LIGYLAYHPKYKFSSNSLAYIYRKPFILFIIIASVSSLFFLLLPELIFDDAAIVLRYMDHFAEGHFFKYNAADAPVYGISGFLHGLFAGLLSYSNLVNSEQALWISNYIGFILTSWFIYRIYAKMVYPSSLVIPLWLITITTVRSFLNVTTSGLETPLHLGLVTGAVCFFVYQQQKAFYFFLAMAIISKLDALPVVTVLLLYHFILYYRLFISKPDWKKQLLIFGLYFLFPLITGIVAITLLFGSPLPQSAYAKLYYHYHPSNSWFPFLVNFTSNTLKRVLVVTGLIIWSVSLIEAFLKRNTLLLLNGLFGSLFVSVMALFYFYNPGEQMIWYYAMPELLITMQVLHGLSYVAARYLTVAEKYRTQLLLVLLLPFSYFSWKDVILHFNTLSTASKTIEKERQEIGNYIKNISLPGDTLLSSHGLPTRFFKGYVLDLSGLNSKLVTRFHIKADSIINQFEPTYIINHAFPVLPDYLENHSYEIVGLYRNITLANYHSWVVLKKITGGSEHKVRFLDEGLNNGNFTSENDVLKLSSKNGVVIIRDTFNAASKKLHIGIAKEWGNKSITVNAYRKGVLLKEWEQTIAPHRTAYSEIINIPLDISGADSIILEIKGADNFIAVEPIYELVYLP
jgi:hypothetical protein